MLHEPQSLAPLYEELDAARDAWLKSHPGTDLNGDNLGLAEFLSNASLPLITSIVSESLRVSSSSFSIRTVVEDGVTINGYPQFEFSKDDMLLCQLRSVHLDQEVYGPDAATFKPDRFLGSGIVTEGGSRKPFLPFGGGVSQCEGRHYASKGCKLVLALFLLNFDIKLDPAYEAPSSGSALLDMTRIGTGVLHPTKPTHILVSKRK
ncbi:Cholesterol 7-alpha-monooxygenase [Tulasnella sp. 408]|nr:Cholesterol 7-alpha-monooxygenase [Tulasnella sp. 408]